MSSESSSRSPRAKKARGPHPSPSRSPSESSSSSHSRSSSAYAAPRSGQEYYIVDLEKIRVEKRKEELSKKRSREISFLDDLKERFEYIGLRRIVLDENHRIRDDFDRRNNIIQLATDEYTPEKGYNNWTMHEPDRHVHVPPVFHSAEEEQLYLDSYVSPPFTDGNYEVYKKDINIPNRYRLGGRVNKSRRRKRYSKNKTTRRK